ncbi:hypothetical protein CBL_08916 [Carabus blaptoides fortunei]
MAYRRSWKKNTHKRLFISNQELVKRKTHSGLSKVNATGIGKNTGLIYPAICRLPFSRIDEFVDIQPTKPREKGFPLRFYIVSPDVSRLLLPLDSLALNVVQNGVGWLE